MTSATDDDESGRNVSAVATAGSQHEVPVAKRVSLFAPEYRATTVGILLVITLIAFEAMAVATAMPRAVAVLHGLAYYGWAFTGLLMANVVGVVLGGEVCDRTGARLPLVGGLIAFLAGLLVAGTAADMAVFVAARALQGFGGGLVIVAIYVVIAEVYDESLRPAMFAANSAAWVVPALVGPVVSGALTEHVSWRAVFLAIAPFVAVGLALVWPSVRGLPAHTSTGRARPTLWRIAPLAAVGIAATQYAGQHLRWFSLVALAVGLGALTLAVPRLLPGGTLRAVRGMPAVIACRGLVAGAFMAVDAYVPLTLTTVHGYSPTAAGVPLMIGAIGWSLGSWLQGRLTHQPRARMLRLGFTGLTIAALGMSLLTVGAVPGWVAYLIWPIGGAGIGTVFPVLSVLLLELSPAAERGRNSSALTICDTMTTSITIGFGGALVAAVEHGSIGFGPAIRTVDWAMAAIAVLGIVAAGRVVTRHGAHPGAPTGTPSSDTVPAGDAGATEFGDAMQRG